MLKRETLTANHLMSSVQKALVVGEDVISSVDPYMTNSILFKWIIISNTLSDHQC